MKPRPEGITALNTVLCGLLCLPWIIAPAACVPGTGSYPLPDGQRAEAAKHVQLCVPESLFGPLDAGLPALCRALPTSVEVVKSPEGCVGVAWSRDVDMDLFDLVEPSKVSPDDPSPAKDIPARWRLRGTDRLFDGLPNVKEVAGESKYAGIAIIRPGSSKASTFITGVRTEYAPDPAKTLFWHRGGLYCIWRTYRWFIVSRADGTRLTTLAKLPAGSSGVMAAFSDNDRLRLFGVESYYRKGEPPACFGGSSSDRFWHRTGTPTSWGPKTCFRDVYKKWRHMQDIQIVQISPDHFACFSLESGWSLAIGFETHPIFYQDDLLAEPRRPKAIGKVRVGSEIAAVARGDGGVSALWMEEISFRNRPDDPTVTRLVVAEIDKYGVCSKPVELARGGWSYQGFAAAATENGKVFAIWENEQGALSYMGRDLAGVWSKPVRTSLKVGWYNWLVASDGALILITYLDRNLYWCRLRQPFDDRTQGESKGAE